MSGAGDSPPKPAYRVRRLDIGGGCEMAHGEGRGNTWHGVDVLVEGMSSEEPENERRGGLTPKNRISSTPARYWSGLGIPSWDVQQGPAWSRRGCI